MYRMEIMDRMDIMKCDFDTLYDTYETQETMNVGISSQSVEYVYGREERNLRGEENHLLWAF